MTTEIRKLREGKGVATSTIRNFYLRRTTPQKKTIEVIQQRKGKCKQLGWGK